MVPRGSHDLLYLKLLNSFEGCWSHQPVCDHYQTSWNSADVVDINKTSNGYGSIHEITYLHVITFFWGEMNIQQNQLMLVLFSRIPRFWLQIIHVWFLTNKYGQALCVARRFTGTFPAVLWRYLTCYFPFQYIVQSGWQILIPHDDMKISGMLFPISIYSSRGWRILIPHDDMKISGMLFPISIYSSEWVADFNPSWWYEDIWHVISHFNI